MKRLSNIIFLLFLLLFGKPVAAQLDKAKLDAYLLQAQKDWKIPGIAVGIVKDGKVILSKGYGMLEAGKTDPANGQSLFAIASNTKAFISAALGILVEEGKVEWDDPVRKYLPYFALYDAYASEHTTVRDLLCHRVGLGTYSGDVIWYKSEYSAEEVIKRVKYVPQAYGYRAGYGYTNLMFITAGEVIKAASGKSWDAFIKERIFEPLGMNRTQTSVSELDMLANVAQPHKPDGWINNPIPYANWDNMGAAGGIISCTDDMLKWIQLQLDQGRYKGKRIFSEQTQQTFWTPHNNYTVSKSTKEMYRNRQVAGYALGWSYFDYAGKVVMRHGGGYDGMYSQVAMVPDEELGIVVLTNSMRGISSYLTYYILDMFMEQEEKDWSTIGLEREKVGMGGWENRVKIRAEKRKMGTQPSHELSNYEGTYADKMYGEIEINLEGENLLMNIPHAPQLGAKLIHWHDDTFEIKWNTTHAWFDFGTLRFILDNNREVIGLEFDVPNYDIFFDEIHAKKIK